jgi:hypothetical protein
MSTAMPGASRWVGARVGAALNPETDDAKAAGIAMRLIETADPPAQASLEDSGPITSETIDGMSLSELLVLAERMGIDLSRDSTPPEPRSHAIRGAEHQLRRLAQPWCRPPDRPLPSLTRKWW